MTIDKFEAQLPDSLKDKISGHTLKVWYHIHKYVVSHGQTDRYDRKLRQYLENKVKWMSETTLQRHLKSMATANILIAHRIGNRYTDLGKAMLPFGLMAFGDGPPAGAFKCYTLPGMSPIFKTQKE
ncbi:MAG: hypothetical protein A2283_07830 [Lentisphaerae bacterium RIFOXYA12_FULL_48_11]|nr:MAG: hypothetical protein A2283_07830 [Lentisphaerae bacterium RIFOXYA12_FULL_48_11]